MSATACPSDLVLELFLLDPPRAGIAPHLDACPGCAKRIARMRLEGEEFHRFVFPATVGAVEEALSTPRLDWRRIFAPAGALAAAAVAAVLFFMIPAEPHPDYEGVKGPGMLLSVFANGDDPDCAVAEGEAVHADAQLWFRVSPATQCWLWIMSVDASGQISRLYPPPGTSPQLRSSGDVPGGVKLDGQAGPERVFAVCAPDQGMTWDEVKAAAAEAASGGADGVRSARNLGGSLAGTYQATVLLEKRP